MTVQLSTQQQAVVDWVKSGHGSAFGEAVAGAGKTTTALMAAAEMRGSVAVMAYNASAAKEFQAKAQKLGLNFDNQVRFGTCHSFGLSGWRRAYPEVKFGPEAARLKKDKTLEKFRWIQSPEALDGFVLKLVSLAKNSAFGLFKQVDDRKAWYDIVDHHDLAYELDESECITDFAGEQRGPVTIDKGIDLAIRTLKYHRELGPKLIDFDDMLWLPVVSGVKLWQNDWVVGDEWQDANVARRMLARKMLRPGGRALFIGDRCQPAGTEIEVPAGRGAGGRILTKRVAIEDLKVGDSVVSFSARMSAFRQIGRRVNGITKRSYEGLMVRVITKDRQTVYTSNHYCYAQLKPIADKYCVYLMRRGDLWRVGTSRIQNSHGTCGPMARKRLECADDVWILDLFNSEREAKTNEFKIATEYGVPELLFRAPGSELGPYWYDTQVAINLAWESLDKGRLKSNAHDLLEQYGRDPAYPLNETASRPGTFWVTRPVKIRACNLMDGMSVLHYEERSSYSRADFNQIEVRHGTYKTDVYSLDVDTDHTYVADGIATFNCQAIYGFTGADSDSITNTIREFSCCELPMTVTFRCPKAVVAEARTVVSHIEAHEAAPEGKVEYAEMNQILKTLYCTDCNDSGFSGNGTGHDAVCGTCGGQARGMKSYDPTPDDAILCRLTKPLVSLAFQLIKRGVACHVEGRDIGADLVKLVDRFKSAKSVTNLRDRLAAYAEREVAKLTAKGRETQAEALMDRVETLYVIMDSAPPATDVAEIRRRIQSMFVDGDNEAKPTLTLATVHRSKGREWNRVFILGRNAYMPSPWARQDWQKVQENNLIYVSITRAMKELVYVNVTA